MGKYIELPNCNLGLTGSGHDTNGNKVIKLNFAGSKGFSIQTNGNLKRTGTILRGLKTFKDMSTLTRSELKTITKECITYIKNYGSANQKKHLRTY